MPAAHISGMTDISNAAEAAREEARTSTGQFGAQERSGPELLLAMPERTKLPIIAHANVTLSGPVAYPQGIPAGGKVEAGIDDVDGGVFVSITFEDELDEDGEPVRISCGGDDDYDNGWSSLANGEPGFADDNVNDAVLGYLREVRTHVGGNADAVRYAATEPLLSDFVAAATAEPEPADHSDETHRARTVKRGEQIVTAFAEDGPTDEDERVADAIADILIYAQSKGLDLDDVLERSRSYATTED